MYLLSYVGDFENRRRKYQHQHKDGGRSLSHQDAQSVHQQHKDLVLLAADSINMRITPDGCPSSLAPFYSQELLQIALPRLLRDNEGALLDVVHQRRGDVRGLGDAGRVVEEPVGKDERAASGDKPVLVVGVVAWYDKPGAT